MFQICFQACIILGDNTLTIPPTSAALAYLFYEIIENNEWGKEGGLDSVWRCQPKNFFVAKLLFSELTLFNRYFALVHIACIYQAFTNDFIVQLKFEILDEKVVLKTVARIRSEIH